MRFVKWACLLIVVPVFLLGVPLAVLAQQPPPVPPPAPTAPVPAQQAPAPASSLSIVPGSSMAGVSVGDSVRRILTRFGGASETRTTRIDLVHIFGRFGLAVYSRNEAVTAVSTTNSLLKVNDVLGVGYRVESAIAAFGRAFRQTPVEGYPGIVYEDRGIAFGLDGNAIALILVFRPGTSASVSGLQPDRLFVVAPPIAPPLLPAGFPDVSTLKPFTPQTNYMSLPGYLRYAVFQTTGIWITYGEAARVLAEQRSALP